MGTLSVDKLVKTSSGAAEFTLPATDGTSGQAMITDGSGQLSLGNITIPDNAVTNAKMADDAVGLAELSATGTASASTFLRGDNAWASAAAGFNSLQTFTADGTWTKPSGITKIVVECQGGGGCLLYTSPSPRD